MNTCAAGLVSAAHPAHRYKPILAYSCELYAKLDKESGEVRKSLSVVHKIGNALYYSLSIPDHH